MADRTAIEWTDATWNVITGCSVISPGCTNCYAMKLAGTRLKNTPSRKGLTIETKAGPVWNGEVRFNESMLDQPLHWRRPRRIFVCAHADLFHEAVPDEWIDRVFAVMALCPQHTFQVLTKRPGRMRDYVTERWAGAHGMPRAHMDSMIKARTIADDRSITFGWPLPNVWLGVSVEDQARANERIPILLDTPAAIRWISAEPLLGSIDLRNVKAHPDTVFPINALHGFADKLNPWADPEPAPRLDWVVVGGESGPGARPMHPDWARSLRDQCAAAGVPFLFKQWGEWAPVCEIADTDALYHPAPERHPDATRKARYRKHVLHVDGSQHGTTEPMAFLQGTRPMSMYALGKKRAGRSLDGVIHDAWPEVSHV